MTGGSLLASHSIKKPLTQKSCSPEGASHYQTLRNPLKNFSEEAPGLKLALLRHDVAQIEGALRLKQQQRFSARFPSLWCLL